MSVYVRNLVINAGEDFSEDMDLIKTSGLPVNISGFTAVSHLRKSPNSSTYTGIAVSFRDPTTGKITVSIANTISAYIKPGRHVYDIMLLRPNGTKTIAVEGTALVRPGISTGCF